jgi:hypothetical protein
MHAIRQHPRTPFLHKCQRICISDDLNRVSNLTNIADLILHTLMWALCLRASVRRRTRQETFHGTRRWTVSIGHGHSNFLKRCCNWARFNPHTLKMVSHTCANSIHEWLVHGVTAMTAFRVRLKETGSLTEFSDVGTCASFSLQDTVSPYTADPSLENVSQFWVLLRGGSRTACHDFDIPYQSKRRFGCICI